MKNNYTIKIPFLDVFAGDNYEYISNKARYSFFSFYYPWLKSDTLNDNVSYPEIYLNLYHFQYTGGQTSNLVYRIDCAQYSDISGRNPVEDYNLVSDFTGLTYYTNYYNVGFMDSSTGNKRLNISYALYGWALDATPNKNLNPVIYIRLKDSSGTSTPTSIIKSGGTILLGDIGNSNLYGFYDRSSSSYPSFIDYTLGSPDDTFDGTMVYTGMSGANNHLIYSNSYSVDEIQQLDTSGKIKRIFWKFNIPEKLYGKIDFSLLNLYVSAEDNTSRICSFKLYGTDDVSWNSSSTNTTMNSIFSSSIYLGDRKGLGCLKGIGNHQIDVGGHPYLSEYDSFYAAIPGTSSYQFQDTTQFTLIMDDIENTRSTSSVSTSSSPLFGRNDLTQSARKTLISKYNNSVNSPYISHYYVPPVIISDKTSFTKSVVAGSNVSSDSFVIINNGRGRLYPIITDNMSWLSISGGSGPIVRNGSLLQDPMYPTDPIDSTASITFNTSSLSVGSYSGNITITDSNAYPTSVVIPVSLTVTTGSSVGVDTTSIEKTVTAGTNGSSSTFKVFDNHDFTGDSINYTISESISWLSVSPTSGTSKSTTDQKTHTISYTTNTLALGDYTGNITVSDASSGTSKVVKVVAHVVSGSYIVVSTSTNSISQTITAGQNASPVNIQVWDGNSTSLDSINVNITKDQSWLSVSPTSITSTGISNAKTISVTFNTSSLSLGIHTATITLNDPILSLTETINVSITVISGASITTDVSSLNLSVQTGNNLGNQIFNAWDLNSSLVDYIIYDTTTNVSWMNVTPNNDSSSNSSSNKVLHTITFDTSSLIPGDYTGIITLSASNVSSERTIDVFLTVTSGPYIVTDKDSLSYSISYLNSLGDDTINVWDGNDNSGNNIDYTITSDIDWITLITPNSGISSNSSDIVEHTISFDTDALLPGTYTGIILIEDAINSLSKEIPVTLIINSQVKGSATYDYIMI